MLIAPRYGTAALADLVPSVLAGLGVAGETDRVGLGLDGINRVCVLLVDGLGAELLAAHAADAPFLSSIAGPVLTAGFPSTTGTSLTSLGSGVAPGEHGMVGYLLPVPGHERLMNPLKWRLHGPGARVDLLKDVPPEEFQPVTTAFQRAAADGITVTKVCPPYQNESGLTRAALRGGTFRPAFSMGDLADGAVTALSAGDRSLVYAYHGDLDLTGHARGPHSRAWAMELRQVDAMARSIAERLPDDAALIVTADHGMVEIRDPVDFDSAAALQKGVARLGGEPRARHVYTNGADVSVVTDTWRTELGENFQILTRAEAVQAGWFGPVVADRVEARIGDLIVVPTGSSAIIRSGVEPLQSMLIGHHGSLTPAEMIIPMLIVR